MDIIGIKSRNNLPFILASQSPRRRYLLNKLNVAFEVEPASINEIFNDNETPDELVQRLAHQKAETVSRHHPDALILGADTVVVLGDEIIGKPTSEKEAEQILRKLSGQTHCVYTGVALLMTNESGEVLRKKVFYEQTSVTFASISPSIIQAYIKTGEPMDKAGGYGVQDKWGAGFVERMDGDFYNVMGLPLHKLINHLNKITPEIFNLIFDLDETNRTV